MKGEHRIWAAPHDAHLQVLLKFCKPAAKSAPENIKEAHVFLSVWVRARAAKLRRRRADELAWAQIDARVEAEARLNAPVSHKENRERRRA
jgi:hypothetical protein